LFVFVAESDQHYSPARIAGWRCEKSPSLKVTNNDWRRLLVAFSDKNSMTICPGDSRRAIMLVAVGDKKHSFSNTLTFVDTNA